MQGPITVGDDAVASMEKLQRHLGLLAIISQNFENKAEAGGPSAKEYGLVVKQLRQIGGELWLVPQMMRTLRRIARHPGDPRGADAALAQLALALYERYEPNHTD